jgi:hypothetical protein
MYIYIDSKIDGTFAMLIQYFEDGIFDKNRYTVLLKYYKTSKKHKKLLEKNYIRCTSIHRWSDLPDLTSQTIFYLFNAQSNCRLVSYREAKHIFIGHGESNKLASAKPIFRIYDYIAVAGDASIDRFLEQEIFNECDVQHGKFLKVGAQFIGKAKYHYDEHIKTILYAPTWEGGIEEENYSSITRSLKSFHFISKYMKKYAYTSIVIQPHPNIGHRDKTYISTLIKGILFLKKEGFFVSLRPIKTSLFYNLVLKFIAPMNKEEDVAISQAFCDVSAMEIQLLNKGIPTFVFFNDTKNLLPDKVLTDKYYKNIGIYNFKSTLVIDKDLLKQVKKYYIEPKGSQEYINLLGE